MPLYPHETLPATSQDAFELFLDRYVLAYMMAEPPTWSGRFGAVIPTAVMQAKFPLSILASAFKEFQGSNRFRTLGEKDFEVKVVEYDDGVEAVWKELQQNVYALRKWASTPERWRKAEARLRNKKIAALLEGGTAAGTCPVDGKAFFDTDHPANLDDATLGTFSNYQSAAKAPTIDNIIAEITLMQGVLDENGDKLDVEPTHILLPTEKYWATKADLMQARLASGEDNPLLGVLEPVHVPEFDDANDWYLLDAGLASDVDPWIDLVHDQPELFTWDAESEKRKDTGRVGASRHVWHGYSLVFPHAIRRVAGA